MDKSKVIEAYYRGLLTIEECAQIMGSDQSHIFEMIESSLLRKPTNAMMSPLQQMERA